MTLRNLSSLLLLAAASSLPSTALADDIREVKGEYTFLGDGNHSPAECRRLAAELARVEALKEAFGTIVSQDILQSEFDDGNSATSRFLSLSSTETKGEWLGDIGEPEYEVSLDKDDNYIVKCKVRGRAKPITNRAAEFEAKVLRNGTDLKMADTRFRNGDDLFLYFSAPTGGYLSAFIADEEGEVYCILPYSTGDVDEIHTRRGKEYVFFDPRQGTEFGNVDELAMATAGKVEFNKLYVVFSPEPYTMPAVKFRRAGAPPSVSSEDFASWLVKSRRNDQRMGVKSMNIVISPSGKKTEIINF